MKLTLPTDSTVRKNIPLYSGCYTYFPAALAGVAMHSKISNDKHNPGEPLHHARGKSMDHPDCISRHLMDLADMQARRVVWTAEDQFAMLAEANALCWRALALSQELHEKFGAPLAPAARVQKGLDEDPPYLGEPTDWEPKSRLTEKQVEAAVTRAYAGVVPTGWETPLNAAGEPFVDYGAKAAGPSKSPEAAPTDFLKPAVKDRQSVHGDDARRTSTREKSPASAVGPLDPAGKPYRP